MSNSKKPVIRFVNYKDDWEQRKLKELCNKFQSGEFIKASEIASIGDYPVYGGNGLRGYTNTFNHNGEYALIGRQGALCGNVQLSCGMSFFTEHAVAVKANYENETRFLYHLFETMNLGQYSGQSAQPGLAVGTLIKLVVPVPVKAEQQKIYLLLDSLDNTIALHQRELTKLKQFKQSMLQKMFPREVQTEPEIRFEGFNGEWEECTLDKLGYTYGGLSGKNKNDFGHGEAKYVTYMNVFKNTLTSKMGTEKVEVDNMQKSVKYGDVFFTVSSETPEEVGMASVWLFDEKNIYLNSFCFGYRFTEVVSPYYSAYMLRSPLVRNQFKLLAQGISRFNISKRKAMEIIVFIPSLEEQRAIGTFFRNLDKKIDKQEQKLTKIKQFKQAMLQKMFV